MNRGDNVQPGSCKIQDERTRDDAHLDNAQLVVKSNLLRNVEPQNLADACVFQPFIHRTLPEIRLGGAMDFEGGFAGFGVVFGHEDDTLNSEAQARRVEADAAKHKLERSGSEFLP